MAVVGRLAGALLAETGGDYFLVGNTKEPCDWQAAGFAAPAEVNAAVRPYVALVTRGAVRLAGPRARVEVEGEALARLLAERLLIERNGSVSERLWRLVVAPGGEPPAEGALVDARWLGEIPDPVWGIVRDTVLRCL